MEDESGERLYMIPGTVPNPLDMPAGCPFSDRCEHCSERCRSERPQLKDVPGTGRRVRCFLYDDEGHVSETFAAADRAAQLRREAHGMEEGQR